MTFESHCRPLMADPSRLEAGNFPDIDTRCCLKAVVQAKQRQITIDYIIDILHGAKMSNYICSIGDVMKNWRKSAGLSVEKCFRIYCDSKKLNERFTCNINKSRVNGRDQKDHVEGATIHNASEEKRILKLVSWTGCIHDAVGRRRTGARLFGYGALRRNDDDQLRPLAQVAIEPRMEANREGFKGDRKKGRLTSSPAKCIMHLASSSPRMVGGLIRRKIHMICSYRSRRDSLETKLMLFYTYAIRIQLVRHNRNTTRRPSVTTTFRNLRTSGIAGNNSDSTTWVVRVQIPSVISGIQTPTLRVVTSLIVILHTLKRREILRGMHYIRIANSDNKLAIALFDNSYSRSEKTRAPGTSGDRERTSLDRTRARNRCHWPKKRRRGRLDAAKAYGTLRPVITRLHRDSQGRTECVEYAEEGGIFNDEKGNIPLRKRKYL
ncbi:hypothetical protein EAG_02345 [Camponotus floridanus]|uniref:Uncharacterized protein n=1 Tax=Camponotus floridanus TaxID=104421 RepID=E2AR46_CAMFO|nr:hypothetical protein EAG_02345 [Camponotus floridanus]